MITSDVFTPVSTYRVQFNNEFTFKDLENNLEYLHELGITTIYASPVFEAAPGSMPGYCPGNGFGIWVYQYFVTVKAMPVVWLKRAVYAVAV